MAKKEKQKEIMIINRKAKYEFFFHSEYETGMVLMGTEIKSIREGTANIKEAYCFFLKGELWIRNMFIAEYKFGTYNNHDPLRPRKLLMSKRELKKLGRRVTEKGFTIVPYKLYISDRGFAKLLVVLASGKKKYDKRSTMKDRENKRDLDRLKKIRL